MAYETKAAFLKELISKTTSGGLIPGLTSSMASVTAMLSGPELPDDAGAQITKIVLEDAGLMQRVLQIANSAMYSMNSGKVTLVSRAVTVLGVQATALIALESKILASFSQPGEAPGPVTPLLLRSRLAGTIGRSIAELDAVGSDVEEAVVCAVLHNLGEIATAHYFPLVWAEVQELKHGLPESKACFEVFHTTWSEVGQALALHWGVPSTIVRSMREASPNGPANSNEDWLNALSTASSQCAAVLANGDSVHGPEFLDTCARWAPRLGQSEQAMQAAIGEATRGTDTAKLKLSGSLVPDGEGARRKQLQGGLKELQDAQATSSIAALVGMAVELLYRATGATRAMHFVLNPKQGRYVAKRGLGPDVKVNLFFERRYSPCLFHSALSDGHSRFTLNTRSLPVWWQAGLAPARGVLFLPLVLDGKAAGAIYLDWADEPPTFIDAVWIKKTLAGVTAVMTRSLRELQASQNRRLSAMPLGGA